MSESVATFDAESLGRPLLEAKILSRVVGPDRADLAPEVAQSILRWKFPPDDEKRMSELSEKARQGTLTPAEENEIDSYLRVNNFVSLMKSKARLSLMKKQNGS